MCSGLTVYTLMWFGLKYKKKPVYLFFSFRPWLKIAGFKERKGRLFRYTALLAEVGKKEILSFVSVSAAENYSTSIIVRSFNDTVSYLPVFIVIAVQCSNWIWVGLFCTSTIAHNHGVIFEWSNMWVYFFIIFFYRVQISHFKSALSATFSHYGLLN